MDKKVMKNGGFLIRELCGLQVAGTETEKTGYINREILPVIYVLSVFE